MSGTETLPRQWVAVVVVRWEAGKGCESTPPAIVVPTAAATWSGLDGGAGENSRMGIEKAAGGSRRVVAIRRTVDLDLVAVFANMTRVLGTGVGKDRHVRTPYAERIDRHSQPTGTDVKEDRDVDLTSARKRDAVGKDRLESMVNKKAAAAVQEGNSDTLVGGAIGLTVRWEKSLDRQNR